MIYDRLNVIREVHVMLRGEQKIMCILTLNNKKYE